jgi:hypothetical protein
MVAKEDTLAAKRSERERNEIASAVAEYLHRCGRVFYLARPGTERAVIIDQQWGVDLIYRIVIEKMARDAIRRDVFDKTRGVFNLAEFFELFEEQQVDDHRAFLEGLLDACGLVIRVGRDDAVAIHPPLLPALDWDGRQWMFNSWTGCRPRAVAGAPLVNHSFAIHDTSKQFVLGRNAFQKLLATVVRHHRGDLQGFLLLGEKEADSGRRVRDFVPTSRSELFLWENGFQIQWQMELRPDGQHISEVLRPVDPASAVPLILRMEWAHNVASVTSPTDGRARERKSFRGGIFVQMLCADEATKAARLLEVLFGQRDATGKFIGPSRAGFPAPLAEYSYSIGSSGGFSDESRDLVLHDFRPADQDPETARCLRGLGQPGWVHPSGPTNGGRFDVAISYRRKASAEFVKAMHEALTKGGILAYYDLERMMDDPNPLPAARAANTLTRIYDTLDRARILIVVPAAAYFAAPVADQTYQDNVFCPFELAEAVVATAAQPPTRDVTMHFWVSPDESAVSRANRAYIPQGDIGRRVTDVVQATFNSVVHPRTSGTGSGESTRLHVREDESVEKARRSIRAHAAEALFLAAHGGNQYLTIPQPATSWDFSSLISRIKAALAAEVPRRGDD